MFAGTGIRHSRGDVHPAATDALHVRTSFGSDAAPRRRLFPPDKLRGYG